MQATIQKWGNSAAVRIPQPILEFVNLREHDPIQIIPEGESIIIRKKAVPAHKTLAARLAESDETASDYAAVGEFDASSVGDEVFW